MTTFPGSPRLFRGAIVGVDTVAATTRAIYFQYNPETLTRKLDAQTVGNEGGDRSEVMRLKGAPVETISLEVNFDAADQLEVADPVAVTMGISPQLSALEMLIYPKSSLVIANTALMFLGTLEIIPPVAPYTLFIWGPRRVLPVRITSFSITEEAYDVNLNPIRAKVALSLRVLSYDDFPVTHPGYHLFLSHQMVKEAMAKIGSAPSASSAAGGMLNL